MRIPIVDEQDNLLYYKDKKERDPKEITRVSGLWITDKDGNILLAQRAFTKKGHPGLWGPAVAGSVEEGETYETNIVKEAEEEIGLTGFEYKIGPKIRRSSTHEYFAQWFTATVDKNYPFKKEDKEVEAIKWFSPEELAILVKNQPDIFLPDFNKYKVIFNENQS